MSRPPIDPKKTTAGIAVDPQTLERVIPESRRPDGTVRKQIKIRPGFTPQEDVRRFRGTKQTQMDVNTLPKGHIIGWAPPPTSTSTSKPLSKNAKKKAKRREKKREQEKVPDNWEDDKEDDDDDESGPQGPDSSSPVANSSSTDLPAEDKDHPVSPADVEDDLSSTLDKLNVK